MDKLIESLLSIESNANDNMNELEAEKKAHAEHITKEILQRSLEIKRSADLRIQAMKLEAEAETQAKLDEIEQDYHEQTQRLKDLFETNTPRWRKEWVGRILETGP